MTIVTRSAQPSVPRLDPGFAKNLVQVFSQEESRDGRHPIREEVNPLGRHFVYLSKSVDSRPLDGEGGVTHDEESEMLLQRTVVQGRSV